MLLFPPSFPNVLKTTDDPDDAAGHKSFISAAVQTGFCDWSARYFAQPVMKVAVCPWPRGQSQKPWLSACPSGKPSQSRASLSRGFFLHRNPGPLPGV